MRAQAQSLAASPASLVQLLSCRILLHDKAPDLDLHQVSLRHVSICRMRPCSATSRAFVSTKSHGWRPVGGPLLAIHDAALAETPSANILSVHHDHTIRQTHGRGTADRSISVDDCNRCLLRRASRYPVVLLRLPSGRSPASQLKQWCLKNPRQNTPP